MSPPDIDVIEVIEDEVTTIEVFERTGPIGPAGPTGPEGPTGITSLTFDSAHGFVIGGALTASFVIPNFYVALKAGKQTAEIVKIIGAIEGGTSIGVAVRVNGAVVGSVHTITTTKQTIDYSQTVNDGDAIDLELSSPVGSPTDLGFTIVIESVVTA